MGDLLRTCSRALRDSWSLEIIDEERANATGDMLGVVLKISEQMPVEPYQWLSEELRAKYCDGVKARLLKGVQPVEMILQPMDFLVDYFREEFAVNSPMVHHTDSCVKLTHLATGVIARSTTHRSRSMNYDEALLLLESLVRERTHYA